MARRWRAVGASPSLDDSGDNSDAIGQVTQTSHASKRLEQAQGSLEAEYAVLSEASAQSAALEAMLRNSQPLLWLDNALVLQREKTKKGAQRSHQPTNTTKPTASAPDDELLWDELFMESELRRRRRIQWEVAKRIARVERKISRQPVAQRSWHVRERKRMQEEEKRRQEEQLARERQQRQQERDEQLRVSKEEKAKKSNFSGRTKRGGLVARELRGVIAKEETKLKQRPPAKVDLDFEWPSKPAKSAVASIERKPEHDISDIGSDKENTVKKKISRREAEASPVVAKASADTEGAQLMEIVRESLEAPIPQADSPPQKQPGELKVEARTLMTDFDVDSAAGELQPHDHDHVDAYGRESAQVGTHNASSLGRQVLSEHRTMTTSVSFGAPAVEGARLNSDVLRRLFNDLDADRDGRLNRIETCMALYRLHIEVPAPRIVAFFKRIHAVESETTLAGSRRQRERGNKRVSTHEPLRELINYKQFVAFVTTAFEQQRQRRAQKMNHPESARGGGSGHHVLSLPPLRIQSRLEATSPVAVPSHLIDGHTGTPTAPRVRADKTFDEYERRLVEQRDNGDEADDVTDLVLRKIPDYLMARALASVDSPPKQVQQLVRSSLEKIGERKVDDEIVENVTRDLVREFAQKLLASHQGGGLPSDDDGEDASGLRRAAAYFDALTTGEHEEAYSHFIGDDAVEMQDWWKVLTEEQIAGIVQDIWRQRQPSAPTAVPPDEEQEKETDDTAANTPPAIPEEALTVKDDSTDKLKGVQRVAEKSIQTGSGDFASIPWQRPPSPPPPPPPPPSPPPEQATLSPSLPQQEKEKVLRAVRSTLAQIILASGNACSYGLRREQPVDSRPKEVLAELRRQRRRRQAAAPAVAASWESTSTADSLPVVDRPPVVSTMPKRTAESAPPPAQAATIIAEVQDAEPAPTQVVDMLPSPLPVREVRVCSRAGGPIVPNASMESARLSRSSSHDVLSSYNSSLGSSMSLFREMGGDDEWRYAAQRRRERLGRRGRFKGGSHSVHESLDAEGHVSDGEIVRDSTHDDLSDGELFGGTRRKVVRAKNYRAADLRHSNESGGPSEVAGGSLESGEMLPSMMTMYQNYQQRIIRGSASSLESGEAEDGIVVSVDDR